MKNQQLHRIHEYLVGEQIAKGTFSSVRGAFQKNTFQPVAIKMISKRRLEKNNNYKRIFFGENLLGPLFMHPNIAEIKETIETEGQIFQVMNLYQCDLRELICGIRLSLHDQLQIADDVLAAIEYLHDNYICHRDIKIENVLIDYNKRAHLSDFGFTTFALENLNEIMGSVGSTAPEVFTQNYDGRKADMWSFGVLLYSLFSRSMPFKDVVDTNHADVDNLIFKNMPAPIVDMIKALLSKNPDDRPTASQLRKHRIFKMLKDRTVNELHDYSLPICTYPLLFDRIAEIEDIDPEQVVSNLEETKVNKSKIIFYLLEKAISDNITPEYKEEFHCRCVSSCPPPSLSLLNIDPPLDSKKNVCISVKKHCNEVSNILKNCLIKHRFCVSITPDGVRKAILNTPQEDIQLLCKMTNIGDDCVISVSGDESFSDEIDSICDSLKKDFSIVE